MAQKENVALNRTGDNMPLCGFGCWKVENNIAEQLIYDAIKAGYVSCCYYFYIPYV